jgi:hypothetical protein
VMGHCCASLRRTLPVDMRQLSSVAGVLGHSARPSTTRAGDDERSRVRPNGAADEQHRRSPASPRCLAPTRPASLRRSPASSSSLTRARDSNHPIRSLKRVFSLLRRDGAATIQSMLNCASGSTQKRQRGVNRRRCLNGRNTVVRAAAELAPAFPRRSKRRQGRATRRSTSQFFGVIRPITGFGPTSARPVTIREVRSGAAHEHRAQPWRCAKRNLGAGQDVRVMQFAG